MADTIQRVEYFYAQVPNKAGEGARFLTALHEAGINLLIVEAIRVDSSLLPDSCFLLLVVTPTALPPRGGFSPISTLPVGSWSAYPPPETEHITPPSKDPARREGSSCTTE